MAKRKSKYHLRPDGRLETTEVIEGLGRRHFYGHTDEEIDEKIEKAKEAAKKPGAKVRTFSDVADDWWEKKEPKLSPNSLNSYKSRLKEVKEEFGALPVEEVSAQQILQWLRRCAAQGLAQKGITNRRSIVKSILDYALADGDIPANPCTQLPIVKGEPAKKRRPASEADVQKIEQLKDGDLIARLFYFLEYTGCRVGEATVLQQKDLDLESHKARISKTIAFRGQAPEVKECPKTDAGDREIDLYDNVLEILPHYDDPETFVFFPEGLPTKYKWEKAMRNYRKASGVSSTAHQLRHTYAGIMHSAEVDVKDAQARLGHSSIVMTQDIYTEIERQHNSKIRDKVNAYIIEERLKQAPVSCQNCGSLYTKAADGHVFKFCPDCGKKLEVRQKSSSKSAKP